MNPVLRCLRFATPFALCCAPALAADFTPLSSEPEQLFAFKEHVYFTADDGEHGRELWRCNLAGEAELVADITPGRTGSKIGKFAAYRDVLLFRVDPADSGSELWRTDGTREGTQRIKAFNRDLQEGFDGLLGIWEDGTAFIRVITGAPAVWKTDGTEAGTVPLPMTTEGGAPVAVDHYGITHNGAFYFAGNHPIRGPILARCNQEGKMVTEVDQLNTPAQELLAMDGHRVVFRSSNQVDGEELFISGGSAPLTFMLSDSATGPPHGDPKHLTLLANPGEEPLVYYSSFSELHGYEPWVTNGVPLPEATHIAVDINPGPEGSNPEGFVALGDRMFFAANHADTGKELWTIGRPYNTAELVADVLPGPESGAPYAMCAMAEQGLYFSALDAQHGEELFLAAPDGKGITRIYDINPGAESSFPYYTVALGDHVVFAATDPLHGRELWCAGPDGKARLLADLRADGTVNPSSSPHQLTPSSLGLFFVANDLAHGAELWISDGTEGGTRLVRDIFPGPAGSSPAELTVAGGMLHFAAESGPEGARLWRSDGTEAGTRQLSDALVNPRHLTTVIDQIYLCAESAELGAELWRVDSDGAPRLVKDIAPGEASSEPRELVLYGEHVYFRATDGIHGDELWRSDGTEAGTIMIRDLVAVPQDSLALSGMVAAPEGLFLTAELPELGAELWRFRPEEKKPMLVKDIARPRRTAANNDKTDHE